jgi:hypothetical protein
MFDLVLLVALSIFFTFLVWDTHRRVDDDMKKRSQPFFHTTRVLTYAILAINLLFMGVGANLASWYWVPSIFVSCSCAVYCIDKIWSLGQKEHAIVSCEQQSEGER